MAETTAVVERRALRIGEVAQSLGVSQSKVYQWLASGALKSVRVDGSRRVTPAQLDRFIAERETA